MNALRSQPRTIVMFLPSLEGGGAERVFVELANQFAARGLPVELVLANIHGPYRSEVSSAVRIVDLGASGVLRSLPKLVRYLRSKQPGVLLSALDHANLVAILARFLSGSGTRCVVSTRAVPSAVYGQDRSIRGWGFLQMMRIAYRFADAVIANSRTVAQDLAQTLLLPERRLTTIYNPLNVPAIEGLSREPLSHEWCVADAPPIVLSVGSLTVYKDFPTLIRAFHNVRRSHDCRLVILGEGPDRAKLETLIRQLGIEGQVYLPGFISNPFPWMRHAKVFVSSSLTEGCPNALMQALACGTTVTSTNCVGGSAEILEEGKWGRLVPVGDSDAMAEAIVSALHAVDRPDVRQRARDFAIEAIAGQYLSVLLPDRLHALAEGVR